MQLYLILVFVFSMLAGFSSAARLPCGMYWTLIALQNYLEEATENDDVSSSETIEFFMVYFASISASSYPGGLCLVVALAFRRLIWQDKRLPKQFRLERQHYLNGSPRRFLVTGAASGVGRHLVGALAARGHRVLATDLRLRSLEAVRQKDDWDMDLVTLMELDVTSALHWRQAVDRCESEFDGLDVCLNLAGYLNPAKTLNIQTKDVDLHIDVNLKGVIFGTTHTSHLMARQVRTGKLPFGGHIINFSSLGGIAPVSGVALYIASKYGCRGFSLCASKDLFDAGVFVTCVLPDAIRTPMLDVQLHGEDGAMAFSGDILTLKQVENVIFDRVLPHREREVLIPTSWIRGIGARISDVCSGSLLIGWSETFLRNKGMREQIKAKAAAAGATSRPRQKQSSRRRSKSPQHPSRDC